MDQAATDNVSKLEQAGMRFNGASSEQLAIIDSLSLAEVNMLIGLKDRLNHAGGVAPDMENTGYFVW